MMRKGLEPTASLFAVWFSLIVAGCDWVSLEGEPRPNTQENSGPGRGQLEIAMEQAAAKQKEASSKLGIPVKITNSIGMKLRLIPAGEFMVGAPDSLAPGEDHHRIRITTPFYFGVTEVTQSQWEAAMGTQPWRGEKFVMAGADYPAVYVSWEDAGEFCRELSRKEGLTYRLPTEAEWEYACRAGTTTTYSFGNDTSKLSDYAWFDANTLDVGEKFPHRVGGKRPNAFGLYDVHGNVWELCEYYDGNDRDSDWKRPISGSGGIKRGGCWLYWGSLCRSSFRCLGSTTRGSDSTGFRVVREVVDASEAGSRETSEVD